MILVLGVWTYLRALLGRSTAVTLENVALGHQLAVLQRSVPRPRLRRRDRIFWVCLSRLWANWRSFRGFEQCARLQHRGYSRSPAKKDVNHNVSQVDPGEEDQH